MTFETILTTIGWGKYQIRNIMISFCMTAVMAIQVLSPIFIAYPMPFKCYFGEMSSINKKCNVTLIEEIAPAFLPLNKSIAPDHCQRYATDADTKDRWDQNCTKWKQEIISCDAFTFTSDGSVQGSIKADFGMVCDRSWYNYLLQSLFMVGVFFNGHIMGKASDRFGRRKLLMAMSLSALLSSFVIAFVHSFPIYAALRTIVGFTCFLSPTSIVLVSETVKATKRTVTTQVISFGYSVGTLMLVLIAYFARYWRTLQIVTSLMYGACLLISWFMDESPRWLAAQGSTDEATKILHKITKLNGKPNVPESLLMFGANDQIRIEDNEEHETPRRLSNKNLGMLDALRMPHLRKITLVLTYSWFATSCAFYGLTLNVANIGGNIYITSSIMSLMAIPAYPLAIYLIETIGRRFVLSVCYLFAGVSCISMYFIPTDQKVLGIIMFLLGRVFTLIPFSTLYLFTIELYPTVIRSTAVNYGSSWARVGAIVAPVIAMLEFTHPTFPYIAFGVITVLSGVLILLLPETRKVAMSETMEEASKFISNNPGLIDKGICCKGNKQ